MVTKSSADSRLPLMEHTVSTRHDRKCDDASQSSDPRAHAAARWAHAIVPIVDCPIDPRTIEGWSRWIAASPGAIRNWCFTAGLAPRRSLVFARLLRAVILSEGGRRKPENLLDVVDRRTLRGLLSLAGLTAGGRLPSSVEEFLEHQVLVQDRDALREIRRALHERQMAILDRTPAARHG